MSEHLMLDDFLLASIFGCRVKVNPKLKPLGYNTFKDGEIKDVTDKFVGVLWPGGSNICWYGPNELVIQEKKDGNEERH